MFTARNGSDGTGPTRRAFAVAMAFLVISACTIRTGGVKPLPPGDPPAQVESAARAHLLDGSIVTYPEGFTRDEGYLIGDGFTQSPLLEPLEHRTRVPLGEVAALESLSADTDQALSFMVSAALAVGGAYGGAALYKALFGSCPTVYSYEDGREVLEAESFSYSIAPVFEAADLDRIGARPAPDGILALEVRNEAPETHYLNRLQVLRVAHAESELAVAGGDGSAVVLASPRTVRSARARDGRDVGEVLAHADGEVYRSTVESLDAAIAGDYRDSIELTLQNPELSDRVGLALRVRTSLLTTVLLYDVLLGDQGVRAIDWLGRDLRTPGGVVDLMAFNAREMGMRVEVLEGDRYRATGHVLDDVGPIAWEQIGLIVDVPRDETVHLRLSFLTDMWRIDQLLYSPVARSARPVPLPLVEIRDAAGQPREDVARTLADVDRRYLKTVPGQRYEVRFRDTAPATHTSYFLSAQGYYTEWLRPEWITRPARPLADQDPERLLIDALTRWREQRDHMRARFEATRIPVR